MRHNGFTFIEFVVYSALLSILLIEVTSTWLSISRLNIEFEKLAKQQEASVFVAEKIDSIVYAAPDYTSAKHSIDLSTWHTLDSISTHIESTSSSQLLGALTLVKNIDHLGIVFSSGSTTPTSLEYYHAITN